MLLTCSGTSSESRLLGLVVKSAPFHTVQYFLILCLGSKALENHLKCVCVNFDKRTRKFRPPLNCHCIVLQSGISLPNGVRCCQEGHQTGKGKDVCVCYVLVLPTVCTLVHSGCECGDACHDNNTINTPRECFPLIQAEQNKTGCSASEMWSQPNLYALLMSACVYELTCCSLVLWFTNSHLICTFSKCRRRLRKLKIQYKFARAFSHKSIRYQL